MKNFYVISGIHKDPNKIETIVKSVEKRFGPFEEIEANNLAYSKCKSISARNCHASIALLNYIFAVGAFFLSSDFY